MNPRTLTISAIDPSGSILTLSDGRRYLVLVEHHAIAAKWPVGHAVLVSETKGPMPGSYEVRSTKTTSELVSTLLA
jgi:hypothetical protein